MVEIRDLNAEIPRKLQDLRKAIPIAESLECCPTLLETSKMIIKGARMGDMFRTPNTSTRRRKKPLPGISEWGEEEEEEAEGGGKVKKKKRSRHKRSRHKRSRHKRSRHKRSRHKRSRHKRSRHKRSRHNKSRHHKRKGSKKNRRKR